MTGCEGVEIDRGQGPERLDCDGVVFTGQFRPENALLAGSHLAIDPGTKGPAIDQFWRCSDPSFFAAGNLLRGIETAGQCWREGRAAAHAIAAALQGKLPPAGRHPRCRPPARSPMSIPSGWSRPMRSMPSCCSSGAHAPRPRARWCVRGDDTVISSRKIGALPERRIAWPVAPKSLPAYKTITVSLEPRP